LSARFAAVVGMAIVTGATAGLLPSVIGQAVSSVARMEGRGSAPGQLARLVALVMPEASWAVVAVTLIATVIVVGIGVMGSQLGSALSGDVTAAVRIELMRRVLNASARTVTEAGAQLTKPRLPPGEEPPKTAAKAAPPKAPPGKGPGGKDPAEAQRSAIVQLAVSREAGLVSDFAVSVLSSLPQSIATLLVLAVELVTGGAWIVLLGGTGLFVVSRLLADRASRKVADARRSMQTADAAVFGSLQETIGATEDLRLWGAREQAIADFAVRSYECAAARERFAGALAVSGQIKSVFTAMSPLLIVVAVQVSGRSFGPGDVAKMLLLVPLLMSRLEALDGMRQGLIERGPVLDATVDLLALPAAPPRADDAVRVAREDVRGEVILRDVRFTPPGAEKPVIDGVSLTIPAGSIVGICGPSGCGKSTLLRLILRLDDPDEGHVLLDDVDVRKIEPDQLPDLFGVLRQSAQLLERSVRDNLAIGLADRPSDDAMRSMLTSVELNELASADGAGKTLDTAVRKNPPNFSGGELRRLLLARMLLGGSRVCLLDEPEAGLPSATAEQILASIKAGASGRTHLVVTHAPHLLNSDFNIVLAGGRVVAQGRHEELTKSCSIYRDLLAEKLK
jgi:ATP-binding cassette subfamily B protein